MFVIYQMIYAMSLPFICNRLLIRKRARGIASYRRIWRHCYSWRRQWNDVDVLLFACYNEQKYNHFFERNILT